LAFTRRSLNQRSLLRYAVEILGSCCSLTYPTWYNLTGAYGT